MPLDNENKNELEEDLDGNAMREVFGMFANWTLDQYVSRMHRNVAEELNVFNFELKEKIQNLFEKLTKMDLIINFNNDLASSFVEVRDQIFEDHTILDKLLAQLEMQEKRQQVLLELQEKQEKKMNELQPKLNSKRHDDEMIKYENCSLRNNTSKKPTEKNEIGPIKLLFQEYFDKLVYYLNSSLPNIKSQNGFWFAGSGNGNGKQVTIEPKNTNVVQLSSTSVSPFIQQELRSSALSQRYTSTPIYMVNDASNVYNQTAINDDRTKTVDFVSRPNFLPNMGNLKRKLRCNSTASIAYPKSCQELKEHWASCDGVYVIMTVSNSIRQVYCDMTHNNGGWTLIMRRGKIGQYSLNFNTKFDYYRAGFGDIHGGEFWFGLDSLYQMTKSKPHLLQIDLLDTEDNFISLVYNGFQIGSLENGFTFNVSRKNKLAKLILIFFSIII